MGRQEDSEPEQRVSFVGASGANASPFLFFSFLFLSLSFLFFPLLSLSSSCLPICFLVSPFSFSFPFSSQHVTPPLKPLDTKKHTRGCYDHVMKTKTRRQKRRTSQHRRKKKPERRKSDTSPRLKNVNSRAIAFRLHAQMIYNNNNKNKCPVAQFWHVNPFDFDGPCR